MFAHAGGDAGLGKFAEPDTVNARILIFVIDLRAALLDRSIGRLLELHLVGENGITIAAHRNREIARGLRPRVEMLVEHALGRSEDETVPPFVTLEFAVALVPHQRIARTRNRKDMRAGPVPM